MLQGSVNSFNITIFENGEVSVKATALDIGKVHSTALHLEKGIGIYLRGLVFRFLGEVDGYSPIL